MNKIVTLCCLALALAACGGWSERHGSRHGRGENVVGVYRGVTPCADCEGIEHTLTLSKDGAFELRRVYRKRGAKALPPDTGRWTLSGDVIELFPKHPTRGERQCFQRVDNETLAVFDIACQPIEKRRGGVLQRAR